MVLIVYGSIFSKGIRQILLPSLYPLSITRSMQRCQYVSVNGLNSGFSCSFAIERKKPPDSHIFKFSILTTRQQPTFAVRKAAAFDSAVVDEARRPLLAQRCLRTQSFSEVAGSGFTGILWRPLSPMTSLCFLLALIGPWGLIGTCLSTAVHQSGANHQWPTW